MVTSPPSFDPMYAPDGMSTAAPAPAAPPSAFVLESFGNQDVGVQSTYRLNGISGQQLQSLRREYRETEKLTTERGPGLPENESWRGFFAWLASTRGVTCERIGTQEIPIDRLRDIDLTVAMAIDYHIGMGELV